MKIKDIGSIKISIVLFLLIAIWVAWVSYLNREENIERIRASDFTLSCSEVVKASKSYLSLSFSNGSKLGSYQRVENCQELLAQDYAEAYITKRKSQDVIYGLSLDNQLIIDFSASKESTIKSTLFFAFLIFAVVFGYRVDQIRKARLDAPQ